MNVFRPMLTRKVHSRPVEGEAAAGTHIGATRKCVKEPAKFIGSTLAQQCQMGAIRSPFIAPEEQSCPVDIYLVFSTVLKATPYQAAVVSEVAPCLVPTRDP